MILRFLTYLIKIIRINDQIRDEKLQYDINRESAKISALSSGKIHNYEYLTGEQILPSNQQEIIEQAKFAYSSFGKAFEKQIKTIEDQGKKQVDALEKDSRELYNAIKNNQIEFSEVKNKKNEFLNKLSNIKIGKKTPEQKETINNLERFCKSGEEVINFFRDYIEMSSDGNYDAKQNETERKRLKILIPKRML